MERLTVPDERIDGGLRRAIIDAREVRKEAMTIYWRLKKYEDTSLTPEEIIDGKEKLIKDIDFAIKATGISDHYTIGMSNGMKYVKSLIDGKTPIYDKDVSGWIPVSERLPEKDARVLATIKQHKWITDYDSDWVPESEKTVHPEYTEACEAIYFSDIGWEYRDMIGETAFSEDYAFVNPDINIANPVAEVIAWMPLPEPYRPETGKEQKNGKL